MLTEISSSSQKSASLTLPPQGKRGKGRSMEETQPAWIDLARLQSFPRLSSSNYQEHNWADALTKSVCILASYFCEVFGIGSSFSCGGLGRIICKYNRCSLSLGISTCGSWPQCLWKPPPNTSICTPQNVQKDYVLFVSTVAIAPQEVMTKSYLV